MYKLVFAVCIALIALVVAWLGLQPLDKVALSLRLEEGKTYKARIDGERHFEYPVIGIFPKDSDENRHVEFGLNPNPSDTLCPGRYQKLGMGMSGGLPLISASFSFLDSADVQEIGRYYLEQFPLLAAWCVSSMLVPLSFDDGFQPLKKAAEMVVEPFDDTIEGNRINQHMQKVVGVRVAMMADRSKSNLSTERNIARLESFFPEKPVGAGTSWQVTTDSLNGVPINETMELKVLERKAGTVILELKSTAGTNGVPVLIDSCGITMSVEFSVKMSGLIEMDDSTGFIEDSDLDQTVDGIFRFISAPGIDVPGEEIPFALTGKFKVQLDETLYSRVAAVSGN